MSAWAALVERAHLRPGDTVLVNGATGTAGRLAVQLSKYFGAGKVIATGRSEAELSEVASLGADVAIPFTLGPAHPLGAKHYEDALVAALAGGIDIVIDYLWGESAKTIIVAVAKAVEDGSPVRFVHVGGASREDTIELPGAALRSSAIQLMGSGVNSVPFPKLLDAIRNVFDASYPPLFRSPHGPCRFQRLARSGNTRPGSRAPCSPCRRSPRSAARRDRPPHHLAAWRSDAHEGHSLHLPGHRRVTAPSHA